MFSVLGGRTFGAAICLLWLCVGNTAQAETSAVGASQIALNNQTMINSPSNYSDTVPNIDMVLVKKRDRTLSLLSAGVPVRVYSISLGDDPLGHKQFEGDERTPEGQYVLDWRNPASHYYKSIHISYPNPDDIAYAEARGRDPGGMIMIHGWPNQRNPKQDVNALLERDWTDGCIALTNTAMDEIWRLVKVGTPITIKP